MCKFNFVKLLMVIFGVIGLIVRFFWFFIVCFFFFGLFLVCLVKSCFVFLIIVLICFFLRWENNDLNGVIVLFNNGWVMVF